LTATDGDAVTISQSSFTFVSDLVRRETAMLYDPGKEYLVEARLLPLAREAGCADVDAYVVKLQIDLAERAKVLDALTKPPGSGTTRRTKPSPR
jgi:chemotaxis protein methyltransferase CheR